MSGQTLTDQGFDVIFRGARTANAWKDQPVSDELLKKIYDDMKWGPTSANSCPLRIFFLKTKEAKERLKPFLMEGNVKKVLTSPVTAIFAYDTKFYEHMPFLFPHADAKSWFEGNAPLIETTAFRNATLQAAYFIVSARAHGIDCGPMSGFDNAKTDKEFFPDGRFKSNFICALGYADPAATMARSPRFKFEDACRVL
jgi:3-hydroxypropanoate dehydrogenase